MKKEINMGGNMTRISINDNAFHDEEGNWEE